MATNGSFAQQDQHKVAADQITSSNDNSNLAKDEVGWYFVEQYYTTLSKSPEKLHLFYSKRSQLVCGKEAEVSNVSVGRQAIQERLKSLDFQDCKVRVSNVDSQASDESIVIQVIGETSNKGAEPRKFVQTFVLAQQPSGYFVLNDMLRYIDEQDEPETQEAEEQPAPPAAEAPETAPEPVVEAAPVEQKLISEVAEKAPINGQHTEAEPVVEAPAAPAVEPVVEQVAEEVIKEEEKPKEPAPTPAKVETPAPEPTGPPKPMTWASRAAAAAAAAGPRPVVPLPKTATPPATTQSRAPAPAAAPAAAPAPAPAAAATPAPAVAAPAPAAPAPAEAAPKETSGWQTAGADSKRQHRPQATATGGEKEGTMGYVKYVTDKVLDADLRAALTAHGELTYFDINRQKNCAFVEYKTLEGYHAAVSSNPHVVNGENIVVEPRRPKAPGHNGGASFGAGRGNGAPRGRGGYEGHRNSQGTRGNFGQNRGRGGAARGRGGAQVASNA
ncbi:NTF2 and RRM domain protein [Cordyceps fumosorosea ARSEF 2679]|uniref:NTF2 and RRM domain protein n=1 Tax=Cordyceps fumosorosea (strain ARSEF 2679) TaxID=1081104 RepID=A0A162N1F5_CORFA|nr:NTF2 and RRM domain protein [Cordyceps fumosorosea ARSEF 2679]OAA73959.1 NTF2 and RRM domain protein [Cordyceps fumosorosea ARSEF 2679]